VCQLGGMVVICAGTTRFDAMVDLRYHWTRQKRFQRSHGANDAQAYAYNDPVRDGKIDPCVGRVLAFDDLPRAHFEMGRGEEVFGNTVILVGAPDPDAGRR
jgi:crotonyl-CoA carboxylase/reductase